jgi:hypothetical protein
MNTYTKIAGITFAKSEQYVKVLKRGSSLILEREPQNKFDKNAVRIYDMNEQFLGYINAGLAAKLAPRMDAGVSFCALVSEVTGGTADKPNVGCNIELIKEDTNYMQQKQCVSCHSIDCICGAGNLPN